MQRDRLGYLVTSLSPKPLSEQVANNTSKMSANVGEKEEPPHDPAWLRWVICPALLAICHFFLLLVLSLFFAYRAPWVLYPFALFALVTERGLTASTNYRGQDSLQWPIIIINSMLYGLAIYWLYRRWRQSRPVA
jgi:hypothetical protein